MSETQRALTQSKFSTAVEWAAHLLDWYRSDWNYSPLVVLALTGSPAQAGTIVAMRGIVYVVFALPVGAFIDRWNRKTVMVIANAGSGLAMGSICIALFLALGALGSVVGSLFASQLYQRIGFRRSLQAATICKSFHPAIRHASWREKAS